MRVLVVSAFPPSEDSNGLFARAWAEALVKARNDVRVHFSAGEAARGLGQGHEDLERIEWSPLLTVSRSWKRDQPRAAITRNILEDSEWFLPDVAHIHFNYLTYGNPIKSFSVLSGVLSGLRARHVRTVVTLHSVLASPRRYLAVHWGMKTPQSPLLDTGILFGQSMILNRVLSKADEIVVTSNDALAWLQHNTKLEASKMRQISLGYQLSDGVGGSIPLQSPREESPLGPLVVCVGLLAPYKGLETLVRAAMRLSKAGHRIRVRVIGHVPPTRPAHRRYLSRLRELVQEDEAGSVTIDTRYVPEDEYRTLREQADVIVLPFLDDGVLGSSGSILDMARSTAARIVLTNVPRLRGYEGIPGVFYCPERDPAALGDTILAAAKTDPVNPASRQRSLTSNTIESIQSRYLDAYTRLQRLGGRDHQSPALDPRRTTPSGGQSTAGGLEASAGGGSRRLGGTELE